MDVMVFMGGANGANDIAKYDSKLALRHISNFLNTNSNTNIVVVSVPHRYDLIQSSCVNREIRSFNRKLSKLAKAHQRVSFFKMSKHRDFFTTHCQHLNSLGKKKLAKQLVLLTYDILQHEMLPLIPLSWYPDQGHIDSRNHEIGVNRFSTRAKKTPSIKYRDFLL